jgi:hypothetical protein
MAFPTLTIERSEADKKTRVFTARLLGFLTANRLWEAPTSGSALRPAWIATFATEGEAQPFTTNFRAGRKATDSHGRAFQIAQKAAYRWQTQKVPGGAVTVAYLPELFHLEPARPDESPVRFVLAPPVRWLEEQAVRLESDFGEEAEDAARAALFAAYLDRRTALPVIRDLRFHLQLYRAALDEQKLSDDRHVLRGTGLQSCGLATPQAFLALQNGVKDFLVDQTARWRQEQAHRRVLDLEPPEPPTTDQLALPFAA